MPSLNATRRASGNGTLVKPARTGAVSVTLARHGGLSALLFGPPAIWAAAEGALDLAVALGLAAVLGILAWAAVRKVPLPSDLRQIEAMVVVALLFLLAPLFAAPAFMTLGMSPVDALFEAMSAITTTGLSVARTPDDWPQAGHILRSWMQWCGGLAMATAVLAVLIGPGSSALRLGRVGLDEDDRISSTRRQARSLLGAYAGLTLVCGLPIIVATGSVYEGIALTLAAVSTGGFAPRSDSLASYDTVAQTLVIAASLAGAVSLMSYVALGRRDFVQLARIGSVRRVLLTAATLSAAYAGLLWLAGSADIWPRILDLLSGLSTAGFSTGAMPVAGPAVLVFLVAMIAGGDAGSTGGGLKLARLGLLVRVTRHAFLLPRLPDHAVAPLRRAEATVKEGPLVRLLALICLYSLTLLVLWIAFLAAGYPPLPSLFDSVSTLSTVGLGTGVIGPDLPDGLKIVLTLAMWLGRLEFIAVLLLFLPRTWISLHQRT